MAEQWKDIQGFEGRYQISNLGRVKSLNYYGKCKFAKILKPRNGKYLRVNLGANGDRYIHRLVAHHFVNNPKGLPEVNHDDFDKHNNKASNLKWCTHAKNMRHAQKGGRVFFTPEARLKISLSKKEYWSKRKQKCQN